jgi:uncharacterized membrane protein
MGKGRLEAFSDGVIAVLITIMVLELKVPHEPTLEALAPQLPVFLTYLLSFVFLGIYWNNHHHVLHATRKIDGKVLWANSHLLFWLSLVPFATGWMGQNHFACVPTAAYGAVLFLCGWAYWVLTRAIISAEGKDSKLAKALGTDHKGLASMFLYLIAIPVAFYVPILSTAIYAGVALMWLVPDTRIEASLHE